jgi:hypothetical protein
MVTKRDIGRCIQAPSVCIKNAMAITRAELDVICKQAVLANRDRSPFRLGQVSSTVDFGPGTYPDCSTIVLNPDLQARAPDPRPDLDDVPTPSDPYLKIPEPDIIGDLDSVGFTHYGEDRSLNDRIPQSEFILLAMYPNAIVAERVSEDASREPG